MSEALFHDEFPPTTSQAREPLAGERKSMNQVIVKWGVIRFLVLTLGALALGAGAFGQAAIPQRGEVGPGQGPQITFDPVDWQFWWFLNQEEGLRFRRRLGVPRVEAKQRDEVVAHLVKTLEAEREASLEMRGPILMGLAKAQARSQTKLIADHVLSRQTEISRTALIALGVMGGDEAIKVLSSAVQLRKPYHRLKDDLHGMAAIALGLTRDEGAKDTFLRLLDQLPKLKTSHRRGVAIGCGLLDNEAVGKKAWELVRRSVVDDSIAQGYLVQSACRFAGAPWLEQAESLLRGGDVHSRRGAALGLGQSGRGRDEPERVRRIGGEERDQVTRYLRFGATTWFGGRQSLSMPRSNTGRISADSPGRPPNATSSLALCSPALAETRARRLRC